MPNPAPDLESIDSAELFYAVLAANSGVLAQVSDGQGVHIYGPPGLPDTFSLRKSIMFLRDGGDTNMYIPAGEDEFALYCYGPESPDATAVYRAVFRCLNRRSHELYTLSNGKAIFQYGIKTAGPQDRNDPLEDWPFVYASFRIKFIEITVPL
jgi:hypothetical protein